MKKTIIAVLLALSMLMLLTGCGEENGLSDERTASSINDCCEENDKAKNDCCSTDEDSSNEQSESENTADTEIPDCCG